VALDGRDDHELVPTHDQQMAARIAWEALMKLENVAIEFVQWTVSGVTGRTGNHVQGRVGLEHSNVCAHAPNHAQLLAAKIVLVTVVKPGHAKEYLAQWMVSGVTGKTGNHVQGRVGLEHSNVCARAAAHDQLLAGKIALVLVVNQGLAREYLAQWTENGVIGKTGNHVPRRVGLEHSNVRVHALNHAQLLAGKIVLVTVVNSGHAKEYLVQWTVSGVSGETGNHVQRHVVLEHSNVCARVPDHAQLLAGKIALVPVVRPNHAKQRFAQLTDSGVNGNHGPNAHDLVAVEFKHVLAHAPIPAPPMEGKTASVVETRPDLVDPTLAQLMASGPSGQTGASVPGRVVVDSILVLELAQIRLQGMVGRTVLENLIKLVHATRSLVQLMVNGTPGLSGQPARRHVAKESKRELAHAQTHHQLMEESIVLAKLKRHRDATLSHAQIVPKSLTSLSSWMHRKA